MTRVTPKDAGFTLLELTATMAVFSLVAVMGLQALSGSLRVQERLADRHKNTWETAKAIKLLRRDIAAATPLSFQPPRGELEVALSLSRDALHISQSGRPTLPDTSETGQARVTWRFDAADGVLRRQAWLTLTPLNDRARGPERSILAGVEDVAIRILTPQGWVTQYGDTAAPTQLPKAVEIKISTARHGELTILEAL